MPQAVRVGAGEQHHLRLGDSGGRSRRTRFVHTSSVSASTCETKRFMSSSVRTAVPPGRPGNIGTAAGLPGRFRHLGLLRHLRNLRELRLAQQVERVDAEKQHDDADDDERREADAAAADRDLDACAFAAAGEAAREAEHRPALAAPVLDVLALAIFVTVAHGLLRHCETELHLSARDVRRRRREVHCAWGARAVTRAACAGA